MDTEIDAKLREERPSRKTETPIPMRLTCPACSELHIEEGDFATKPHHTHACQGCGMVWRPAIVATVGVQFLPGFKNAPAGSAASAWDYSKNPQDALDMLIALAGVQQTEERRAQQIECIEAIGDAFGLTTPWSPWSER